MRTLALLCAALLLSITGANANPKGQQQRSMRRGSDKLSLAKPRNMLPAKDRRSQGRPKSTLQDSKGSKGNIPSGEPSKREN